MQFGSVQFKFQNFKQFDFKLVWIWHPRTQMIQGGFWWWKMGNLQSIYVPFSCNCVWTRVFMLKFLCMYNNASMLNVRSVVCLLIYIVYVCVWVDCKCAFVVTRKPLVMCFYCEQWACLNMLMELFSIELLVLYMLCACKFMRVN